MHGLIEECEQGELDKSKEAILAAVAERWRDQEFPSKAVSVAYRRLVEDRMLRNWWFDYGEGESLAVEEFFEFEFDGATIVGVIDRIGPLASGGTRITDFKTGNPDNAPKAEESLQLGIYYLAVNESPTSRGSGRSARSSSRSSRAIGRRRTRSSSRRGRSRTAAPRQYQTVVRETLSALIAEQKRLIVEEVYRPNPQADCFWCDFRTLCPLWPEGRQVFEVGTR